MARNEILATIKSLARSQGYYCRLLRQIEEMDADQQDAVMTMLEKQNFKDSLDLVMFFE